MKTLTIGNVSYVIKMITMICKCHGDRFGFSIGTVFGNQSYFTHWFNTKSERDEEYDRVLKIIENNLP